MGREEPPRRASMAQRVLTKELPLRVDSSWLCAEVAAASPACGAAVPTASY